MSPKKQLNFRSRTRGLATIPITKRMDSVPPLFLSVQLRKNIERLLPGGYHQRMRRYFDTHGCLHCSHNDVGYGANGFCIRCVRMIGKRMRKVDKELEANGSEPAPNLQEIYLRPYDSARQMLADLVPGIRKTPARTALEPKSPSKVYLRLLRPMTGLPKSRS
jgi:hypothetical protein